MEQAQEQGGQDPLLLKQQLLKAEILDKNRDQMKFLQFCISQKENGDDLNNWTYEELKQCVQNFEDSIKTEQSSSLNFFLSTAKTNNPPPVQNYNQNQNYYYNPNQNNFNNFQQNNYQQNNFQQNNYQNFNNPNMQNNIPNGPNFISTSNILNPLQQVMLNNEKMQQRINTDVQNVTIDSTKNQIPNKQKFEIECKKLEKTVLNDKEIKVLIQNPKTTEKSLLTNQFTIYEVFTEAMKWLVHRRYSDFDWLRTTLCKFFPRILIPPLPPKKVGNRRFEEDFIQKRMKFLQNFIDNVMKNETLKSSEAVYAFLCFADRVQFERKVKELNSIMPSQYCEDVKTLSGKLNILYDDFNESYYTNLNNYFKLQYQVLTRLNYNLKKFYRNMTMACMDLDEVSKDFETLNILNAKVSMKEEVTKTYDELSIFFKNWKRILFNENEIIHDKIKHFFKLQKLENLAFIELIDSREIIKQKYFGEKVKLDAKKEKLYRIMDMNKWEIEDNYGNVDRAMLLRDKNYAFSKMCTRETMALENIHKQLGYANYMNGNELKEIINNNSKKFVENVKDFANNFYPSLNDGITLWSTLNTYI